MDPNYPSSPVVNDGGLNTQPPAKRPFPKKLVFIGAGVLVLIVVIVALVMGGGGKKKPHDSAKNGKDSSVYISREGYEDENDAVGDATAIFAKPTDRVISFAGQRVIQACSLLTLDDLKANGILLNANSFTGPVTRNVYDGRGSQQTGKISEYTTRSSDKINNCSYNLKNNKTAEVSIYQSFSVSNAALQDDIERIYTAVPDVNGLKVFKYSHENNFNKTERQWMLRSANATAVLRTDVDDAKKEKLLALVAERLKKTESSPTTFTAFEIKSPIMSSSVLTNCDLLSDTAFKQVLGVDAGALTEEKFASSIGVVEDPDTKKPYNYSSYDCIRSDIEGDAKLTMYTNTYETVEAAKSMFAFEKSPGAMAQNVQPLTPAIGDESFYGDTAALNNAITIRKGRLIVRVNYQNAAGSKIDAGARINALRPVLEAGVKTLTGF